MLTLSLHIKFYTRPYLGKIMRYGYQILELRQIERVMIRYCSDFDSCSIKHLSK